MRSLLMLAGLVATLALSGRVSGQTKGPAMPYPPKDAERPLALPHLGKHEPDKAGKTDPVAEASQGMIGKFAVTTRPVPAPFVRMVVPDPFENRNLLRIASPVPEEPAPPLLLPRK
jgi:hypothetical protein